MRLLAVISEDFQAVSPREAWVVQLVTPDWFEQRVPWFCMNSSDIACGSIVGPSITGVPFFKAADCFHTNSIYITCGSTAGITHSKETKFIRDD